MWIPSKQKSARRGRPLPSSTVFATSTKRRSPPDCCANGARRSGPCPPWERSRARTASGSKPTQPAQGDRRARSSGDRREPPPFELRIDDEPEGVRRAEAHSEGIE